MENNTTSKLVQPLGTGWTARWIIAALGLILATGAILWGRASLGMSPEQRQEQAKISQAAFEEKTGVSITRVALTAQGGMIDLRYLVIDPDKAVIIHEGENRPAIMDEATGKIFDTPWMNHSHSGEYQAGVTYYAVLMNSGGVLSKGSKVTIILGGMRLEHLVVQ